MEKDNSKEIFEQDLHEHFAFDIDVGQEPLRIDKFLMNRIENATRNKIQKAAKEGSIRVNGIIVKSSYKVKKGDKIRILFTHPPYENLLTPENIELDIKYEDDSIIVINKKSGMVVHPGAGNYDNTLVNALLHKYKKNLSSINQQLIDLEKSFISDKGMYFGSWYRSCLLYTSPSPRD